MGFKNIIKLSSKKTFICCGCEQAVTIDKVGIMGDNGLIICITCVPEVNRRRKELYEAFKLIHTSYPTKENIDAIDELALQIGG